MLQDTGRQRKSHKLMGYRGFHVYADGRKFDNEAYRGQPLASSGRSNKQYGAPSLEEGTSKVIDASRTIDKTLHVLRAMLTPVLLLVIERSGPRVSLRSTVHEACVLVCTSGHVCPHRRRTILLP